MTWTPSAAPSRRPDVRRAEVIDAASRRVRLVGSGAPGSLIQVIVDGEMVGPIRVGDDGAWTVEVNLGPADDATVQAQSVDATGAVVAESVRLRLPLLSVGVAPPMLQPLVTPKPRAAAPAPSPEAPSPAETPSAAAQPEPVHLPVTGLGAGESVPTLAAVLLVILGLLGASVLDRRRRR